MRDVILASIPFKLHHTWKFTRRYSEDIFYIVKFGGSLETHICPFFLTFQTDYVWSYRNTFEKPENMS